MTTLADAKPYRGQNNDVALLVESRTVPERFGMLFNSYYPEIHRYAQARLAAHLADDVASETFLIAFRGRTRFHVTESSGQVRAWLYGIATNLIRRHWRDELRRYRALARAGADLPEQPPDEQVAAQVSAQGVRQELAKALAGLSVRERDVLLLVALGDLNYADAAAALGIPYGTVCSRLDRARRKVRKALGGTDPTQVTTKSSGRKGWLRG
ncbi:RNA polymerase sigma factor [Micromonospora sp. NPDC003197]